MSKNEVVKKRPGRPKKNRDDEISTILGIVQWPQIDEHICEISYSSHKLFKKTFSTFKGYGATELILNFDCNKFTISSVDHTRNINIVAQFEPRIFLRYYVKSPIEITIRRQTIESVFQSTGSVEYQVMFLLKPDYHSLFHFILKDTNNYGVVKTYEIPVINKSIRLSSMQSNVEPDLSFTMLGKHFKDITNECKHVKCTSFLINKTGSGPLYISYNVNDDVHESSKYEDKDNKMNMTCNLPEGKTLTLDVKVSQVKPIITANVGDSIRMNIFDSCNFTLTADADKISAIQASDGNHITFSPMKLTVSITN